MQDEAAERRVGSGSDHVKMTRKEIERARMERRARRRPGLTFALGLSVVGLVLIASTLFGSENSTKGGGKPGLSEIERKGISEAAQPWNGMEHIIEAAAEPLNSLDPFEGDRQKSRPAARGPLPIGRRAFYAMPHTDGGQYVQYITTGKQVLRDHGGSDITVHGANFGSAEAEVRVKVGDTWSPHTEWISSAMLVAKSPMGVGAGLPLGVSVSEVQMEAFGSADNIFSYTRPFIYDIFPFQVGSPYQGPLNVTIKAWGIGYWDTHPSAQMDGHACKRTIWVDNSSVICEIPMHARISPENPEIKVEGQRSMCGILSPGVCTVSSSHSSVSSPARIRQEIRELKSRGGDWKAALRTFSARQVVGGLGAANSPSDPCTNIGNCKPQTFIMSLSGAVLMMMGMGSLCICILAVRPLMMWIADDWQRAKEEGMIDEYEDILEADEQDPEGVEYVDEDAVAEEDHKLKQAGFTFDVRLF